MLLRCAPSFCFCCLRSVSRRHLPILVTSAPFPKFDADILADVASARVANEPLPSCNYTLLSLPDDLIDVVFRIPNSTLRTYSIKIQRKCKTRKLTHSSRTLTQPTLHFHETPSFFDHFDPTLLDAARKRFQSRFCDTTIPAPVIRPRVKLKHTRGGWSLSEFIPFHKIVINPFIQC